MNQEYQRVHEAIKAGLILEEKSLSNDLNFLNWLIGISSAGFILLVSKLLVVNTENGISLFDYLILITNIVTFSLTLFLVIRYRLISRKLFTFINQKSLLYEYQFAFISTEGLTDGPLEFPILFRRMYKLSFLDNKHLEEFGKDWLANENFLEKSRKSIILIVSFFGVQILTLILLLFVKLF